MFLKRRKILWLSGVIFSLSETYTFFHGIYLSLYHFVSDNIHSSIRLQRNKTLVFFNCNCQSVYSA